MRKHKLHIKKSREEIKQECSYLHIELLLDIRQDK